LEALEALLRVGEKATLNTILGMLDFVAIVTFFIEIGIESEIA